MRRRVAALVALVVPVVLLLVLVATSGSGRQHRSGATASAPAPPPPPHPIGAIGDYGVGSRVVTFVDHAHTITMSDGTTAPRRLVTVVRYPSTGPAGAGAVRDAPAATARAPFPLIVFGHGFDLTPSSYGRLLDAWASAGYVVAAPVFPLESSNAPGGPNESDLPNQPGDMSYVISGMLHDAHTPGGPFAGLIDPSRVAVAGHSDGGDTALALAYDPSLRDSRVRAAVILSGAEIPQLGTFEFPRQGPPLLAAQGSADTINPPSATNTFFEAAPRPKYLLTLPGAEHLPPYSSQQPQLGVVERVSVSFLDLYLRGESSALARMTRAGSMAGIATLTADR